MGRKQKYTPPTTSITPEQNKALIILTENLNRASDITIDTITEECMDTGFVGFISQKVTKDMIPKGTHWAWNQSNARIRFPLTSDIVVTLFKLNPRKITNDPNAKQPSYKLWIYILSKNTTTSEKFITSFIWCEKGRDNETAESPLVTLQDLSFLREFMSQETGDEIFGTYSDSQMLVS